MNRPTGLTVIGWLAVIGGGLQLLGSLGLVGVGSLAVLIGSTGALEEIVLLGVGFPMWTGVFLMAIGVLGIVLGAGILAQRPWSWVMGIVVYAINLVAGIALLSMTGVAVTPVFVALMSAVILGYLFTSTAREGLGHPVGGGTTPHAPHAA